MRSTCIIPLVCAAALLAPASLAAPAPGAGRVTGTVRVTRAGQESDASGVVVYVTGFTEPPPDLVPAIRQKNKTFTPDLVAVTAGQSVAFPNDDPIFHNVFSTSKARKFDLGQFDQGKSKSKQFPQAGVVDIYCNIHPKMAATILVLPNRRFARAAADGRFAIDGIPEGTWSIYAFSRRAQQPGQGTITVTAGGTTEVTLAVDESRTTEPPHQNKFDEPYQEPQPYR